MKKSGGSELDREVHLVGDRVEDGRLRHELELCARAAGAAEQKRQDRRGKDDRSTRCCFHGDPFGVLNRIASARRDVAIASMLSARSIDGFLFLAPYQGRTR